VAREVWGVVFLDDEGAEGAGNEKLCLESEVSLWVEGEVTKLGAVGSRWWESVVLEVSNEMFQSRVGVLGLKKSWK
jgi:hypothetical protein